MDALATYQRWCARVTDEDLIADLNRLAQEGNQAIEDAFFQSLAFGTAGLRGVLGAGSNRMNIHTVGQATQGIANYINTHVPDNKQVAICYDSRINSELFAKTAAGVLAANGIHAHIFPRLEPTPALSFATRYLGCAIGINVTASHNPSKYNGYKVYGPDGCQITAEIADAITRAIAQVDVFDDVRVLAFEEGLAQGTISYIGEEVLDAYLNCVYDQHVLPEKTEGLTVVYTPLHGTGLECVSRILERIGVTHLHVVTSQAEPDGRFPTCPYPNPEIREALEAGIALCEEVQPDVLLATDPDADRVGIAVKDGKDYHLLTGNEVGVLLLDFICRMRTQAQTLPKDPLAITTIVSSAMVESVAQPYGVGVRRVLTGFKYIGEIIADLEQQGQTDRFIFGFEESYGYLAGTHARDKDAVVACMLICEMAQYYRLQGMNLVQAMRQLYERYGYYRNRTVSYEFEGIQGAQKMAALMETLRNNPPVALAGRTVERVVDYAPGMEDLPPANVLTFELSDQAKVIVRPSGTEPKIKVYFFAVGTSIEQAEGVIDELAQDMASMMA